jgi:hypothetical protein
VAGVGRFRGAHEHVARGKDGLGEDVGAEALGPAVAGCPGSRVLSAAARPGVATSTTSHVGASRHGSNFEWLCSNTILSNFSN